MWPHTLTETTDFSAPVQAAASDLSARFALRRLSLARAFVGQPQFLIMDEPFVSLDAATAESMLELTEALLTEVKPATLLVTHNPTELQRLATRTLALQGQPATLAKETV